MSKAKKQALENPDGAFGHRHQRDHENCARVTAGNHQL